MRSASSIELRFIGNCKCSRVPQLESLPLDDMVFPLRIFSYSSLGSRPTQYAKDVRPKLLIVLSFQYIYCVSCLLVPKTSRHNGTLQFVFSLVQCLVGTYALWDRIDVRSTVIWAMLGFMSAVRATARFLDSVLLGGNAHLPSISALIAKGSHNWRYYVKGFQIMAGPFIFIIPLYYAYCLYNDARRGPGPLTEQESRPTERCSLWQSQQSFQVFQSQGHTLGGV